MSGSNYFYRFLSSVWDNLPNKDRDRFAELWKGYEQVWGDVLQRFLELDQAINIENIPVFLTERWNNYTFDDSTAVVQPAVLTSFQDISLGVNLTQQYELKVSVNGEAPITIDCRGAVPENTSINEVVFRINKTVGFAFARGVFENTTIELRTQKTGPEASIEILPTDNASRNAAELLFGLQDFEIPFKVPRFPFAYTLPSKKISSIPALQDKIRSENLGYYVIEGPDFQIDRLNGIIRFREKPRENMWAKVTRVNEDVSFYNFGWLIDYVDQTIPEEDYQLNTQGLWFAFWQGPKPELIRRALYLLFGLPVSVRDGVVITKEDNVMSILHDDNVIRAYVLPGQLTWLVEVGDYTERFQPLVSGIDVFDKTNLPGFVQTEIGRDAIQQFALPEATRGADPNTDESKAIVALEEHTFLPQINVNAFVRPNINVGSIFNFLENIKPLQKDFYFQVIVAIFTEEISLQDIAGFTLNFDVTPNLDLNQTTVTLDGIRQAYESQAFPEYDLDSDALFFGERGTLTFEDFTGPLPDSNVTFD
jgi:hypothetical protein